MSPFEILLVVYAAVLAAAALGVVYRMIVGPTILDRALSSDSLVTLVVMGMALYVAQSGAAWAGPVMLSLTGMAFIGTVTFARFVAREDVRQVGFRRDVGEPSTETGPHEAIHPGPYGDGSGQDDPVNHFFPEPQEHPAGPASPAPGDLRGGGQDEGAGLDETWTDEDHDDDFVAGFGAEPGPQRFGGGGRSGDGAGPRRDERGTGPRGAEGPTEGAR